MVNLSMIHFFFNPHKAGKKEVAGMVFSPSLYRMQTYHSAGNWLLLLVLTLIWGSSYILIKKGLIYFSPVDLALIRISFSALAVSPFVFSAWKQTPRQILPWVVIIGLSGSGIPAFLFAVSVGKLGSSVSGILNALSPLFTLLLGVLFFQQSAGRSQIAGVLLGLMGAIFLQLKNGSGGWQLEWQYLLLPLGATCCYGLSANITRYKLAELKPLHATSLAMMAIGVPCLLYLLISGKGMQFMADKQLYNGFGYIALLSVLGTVVAWSLFYKLVQQSDALFAASVTYLIPVVALGWGLADGEWLDWRHAAGLSLILIGVYFVSRKK